MAKQGVRKLVGLGLCVLIALVTIVVGGKLGLDVWQMEFLASRRGAALIGKPAPEFALKDLDGNEVTLDEFTGEVLVVDFWATWCGPCRQQMPTYTALQSLYTSRGFTMIGISVDEGPELVQDFAKDYQLNFPLLMADGKVQGRYGGIHTIPTTFVIDKKGIVRYQYTGSPPGKLTFQKNIEELLGEGVETVSSSKVQ